MGVAPRVTAANDLIVPGYAISHEAPKLRDTFRKAKLREDYVRPNRWRDRGAVRHCELQDVVDEVVLLLWGHGVVSDVGVEMETAPVREPLKGS
ncbi:hypothetical protein [Methylobacterium sp. NFXW15]|uniref:hypothetical protein n=1 Tax=Methylobacterium sp. NFXW15 TaxID=2819512 RepID=UPI003CF7EDB1